MPSTKPAWFLAIPWALLLFPGVGQAQDLVAGVAPAEDTGRDAWFPDTAYFARPTASVREPVLSAGALWSTVFRGRSAPAERPPYDIGSAGQLETDPQGEAAFGGNVRIWQPTQWTDGGLTLGLQAGVFGRFRLAVTSNDLVSSDWIIALPLEIARGPWSGRLRLLHWSSHVGDELIERGVERVDFTNETLEALVAYTFGDSRIYGGGGMVARSSLENEAQLGPEFSDDALIRFGVDTRFSPWDRDNVTLDGGVDWQSSDRTEWSGQLAVRLGLTVGAGNRSVRLGGIYHRGPSPMGQFFLTSERYWGIELILLP